MAQLDAGSELPFISNNKGGRPRRDLLSHWGSSQMPLLSSQAHSLIGRCTPRSVWIFPWPLNRIGCNFFSRLTDPCLGWACASTVSHSNMKPAAGTLADTIIHLLGDSAAIPGVILAIRTPHAGKAPCRSRFTSVFAVAQPDPPQAPPRAPPINEHTPKTQSPQGSPDSRARTYWTSLSKMIFARMKFNSMPGVCRGDDLRQT